MAEIRITIAEIVDICVANEFIPDAVSNIEVLGEHIKFQYKSEHPISTKIDIEIGFKDYINGMLFLEVRTNWIVDKFLRFKKLDNLQYLQYEHPVLTFFLQQFLLDKSKIIHIENINFRGGYFKIKTFNE
ncbi:MAG: hypothetical protein HOK80_06050 [Candidatus Cloacimonetes bacterium]|jgi:hypothetical protein|nr:hypothetical protein [Candidatus Cloacimonadota bacterium]MBT4332357.1 hypothetical protein [Candidatus Cloacimonadota bacterium]MBT5420433.1 hypothetical protein [Candidatus Cloacimonadota bacterium]